MAQISSIKRFAQTVVSIVPEIKKHFWVLVAVTVLYESVKFIPPYLVKLIIDELSTTASLDAVLTLGAFMLASLALQFVITYELLRYVATKIVVEQRALLQKSLDKILKLPMGWHENQHSGTLISKTTKASKYLQDLLWFLNNDILPSVIQLLLTALFLLFIEWRIALLFILFTPIILYQIDYQFKKAQDTRTKYHEAYDLTTKEFAQSLSNVRTVKDFAQEEREKKTQLRHLDDYVKFTKDRLKIDLRLASFRSSLTSVTRVFVLILAAYLYIQQALTLGDVVLVFTLVEKAFINLHRLGRVYNFMGDTYESLARVETVLSTPNELEDDGTTFFTNGDIVLDNVSFAYTDKPVLQGVSLTIARDSIAAIVGPSGSGKTTLVKLIIRHYDPTLGSIKIGNQDIRSLPINELRRHVAFVSQHTELFDRSIRENIAYGRPGATDDQIVEAATQANAHEFISKFSGGYDTMIGERGVKLSGGQKQRISIARAVLANTPIIIFDEATSSLDSESEKAVQDAVLNIKGKTLIIIAHRLSTIQHADTILVIDDGRLIEQGSHSDLSAQGGLYWRMKDLQNLGEIRR